MELAWYLLRLCLLLLAVLIVLPPALVVPGMLATAEALGLLLMVVA